MATATSEVRQSSSGMYAPPRPARFYSPELDVLRFAAFMLVFCRHFTNALGSAKRTVDLQTPHFSAVGTATTAEGSHSFNTWVVLQEALQAFDFGVCLFFFLSAFLITRLLLMERASTGQIAVRDFYIRRCLRIWPLYFFFLLLVFTASQAIPVLHIETSRLLAAVFFVANWAAVMHGWQSIAIQPLWSVSVEEQFYLVWPLLARFGRNIVVVVSLVLSAVSIATLFYLGHRAGTVVTQVWPNTLVQGLFLSAGALTACTSFPERRSLSNRLRLAAIAAGGALWIISSAGLHVVRTTAPGAFDLILGYLLVLAGTYLIFTGVAGWQSRVIPGWLIQLGKMSYGLYVFHVACLMVMQQATHSAVTFIGVNQLSPYFLECVNAFFALGLTIACASLSYAYLEKPFLKLKERFTVVDSRPA